MGWSWLISISNKKGEGGQPEKPPGGGKVIPLFSKSVTKTSQSTKRAHGD
jgi:hypothetical protein